MRKRCIDELLDSDDDEDDDIDFDQLGGVDDSDDGVYETSYYLKRLKEYDPELFKFKSKKKQSVRSCLWISKTMWCCR